MTSYSHKKPCGVKVTESESQIGDWRLQIVERRGVFCSHNKAHTFTRENNMIRSMQTSVSYSPISYLPLYLRYSEKLG